MRCRVDPEFSLRWEPSHSRRFLAPFQGHQAEVDLDGLATVPAKCRVSLDPSRDGALPFGPLLGAVVEKTVVRWYEEHGTSEAERRRISGSRRNCIRAPLGYKARPLDGVWATAPYLHNGSVPNLYLMLGTKAERDEVAFSAESREFDPVNVGLVTKDLPKLERFDVNLPGNSNAGHEFREGKERAVVGPPLDSGQRLALIEYLKSL